MLFSTENPRSSVYISPKFIQGENEKRQLAGLGFKPSGQRNTFGKIASWMPGWGMITDERAKNIFKRYDATGSLENLDITKQRDAQKLGIGLEAIGAIGSGLTGNFPGLFSLGSSAFGSTLGLSKSRPEYNFSGDYTLNDYQTYAKGGDISPSKAKEMLKNPPHGKKLTGKQTRFFQAIAHGWKPSYQDGGDVTPVGTLYDDPDTGTRYKWDGKNWMDISLRYPTKVKPDVSAKIDSMMKKDIFDFPTAFDYPFTFPEEQKKQIPHQLNVALPKFGDGGQPTKQPKPLEPWQKAYAEHHELFSPKTTLTKGGNKGITTDINNYTNAASDFDQDMRLVRDHMRMPHIGFETGGMMKGGEDMVMIDKKTGQPQGEISYGENVFSKEATAIIKSLAKKKDHMALGKFVAKELREQPKNSMKMQDGGDVVPQQYIDLIHKYFPKDQWDTAMKILSAENPKYAPDSINVNTGAKGKYKYTKDIGLFQVNETNLNDPSVKGILTSVDDLKDPEKNIKAAAALQKKYGWDIWSTYNPQTMTASFSNPGATPSDSTAVAPGFEWTSRLGTSPITPSTTATGKYVPDENKITAGTFTIAQWRKLMNQGDMTAAEVIKRYEKQYDLGIPQQQDQQFVSKSSDSIQGTADIPAANIPRTPDEISAIDVGKGTPLKITQEYPTPPTSNRLGTDFYSVANQAIADRQAKGDGQNFFDKIGGAEQIFNLAKFITGTIGATQNLPHWQVPQQWRDYVSKVRDMSNVGLTPQERALGQYNNELAYTADISNIRDISGGNSAFALGNQGAAINRWRLGNMQLSGLDAQLRRQNLGTYGNVLTQDVGYGRQKFEDIYNLDMQNKIAAAQLGQSGLQGIFDASEYSRWQREMKPYYDAQTAWLKSHT